MHESRLFWLAFANVLWGLLNVGGLLERKPWAQVSEMLRLVGTLALALLLTGLTHDASLEFGAPVCLVLLLALPRANRPSPR